MQGGEAPLLGGRESGEADRAFQDAAVTQEEIERFTVAEGLSDVERAQLYITSQQAVQELAVIQNLPGLVRAVGRGAWTTISRSLAEVAEQLDGEGQVVASESFATLARERLLPAVDITDVILPLVLTGVGDGSPTGVQAAWLACLADVAGAIEPSTLHSRVLPAILQRGSGGGKGVRERCLCTQLLGAVVPHAAPEDLQRTLLRLSTSLCQDTEWQVRHAACQQLPTLAAAAASKLGAAGLGGVVDDLFSLLDDEEALVRAAAWRALAAVLDLLSMEQRRQRALPLLLQQCRDPEHHAEVHRSLTAGFGVLMGKLVADMEGDAEVTACLGCYRSLAWRHDHATRLNCAKALPGVLRAATARRYGSHLHDTLVRLASDADVEVRLAVAAALPEVAATLGRDRCCQYMRQPVAALLQDERQEVQAALLHQLPEVFDHFSAPGEEQRSKTFAAFVEPLLRLEAASGYSWRLQLALLQAMASFPAFFSADHLHDRFLPLALKYMADGAAALRDAAAAAAAAIWRALRKAMHRTGVYSRLIHDFAQAKSFRQRMVFLDCCRHAQRHFSSKFVKANLLEPALTLAYDPVANVRLHLAAAMPALKQAVTLPDDVHLLERLNSAMSHLITDGDGDVCQAARKANEEFKRLPVRMSCGALESSSAEVKAFEAADAARAESERDFVFDSDQLDKIRADIAAYDELLRPANLRLALALPAGRADPAAGGSSGASSRLGSSRAARPLAAAAGGAAAAVAAGPVAARGRLLAAAMAAAGGHHRSSSDPQEGRRDKALLGNPAARSSSADGHLRKPGALPASTGSSSSDALGTAAASRALGSAGSRTAARLKGAALSSLAAAAAAAPPPPPPPPSLPAAAARPAGSTGMPTVAAPSAVVAAAPSATAAPRHSHSSGPAAGSRGSGGKSGLSSRAAPSPSPAGGHSGGAAKAAAPASRLSRPSLTGTAAAGTSRQAPHMHALPAGSKEPAPVAPSPHFAARPAAAAAGTIGSSSRGAASAEGVSGSTRAPGLRAGAGSRPTSQLQGLVHTIQTAVALHPPPPLPPGAANSGKLGALLPNRAVGISSSGSAGGIQLTAEGGSSTAGAASTIAGGRRGPQRMAASR